MMKRQEAKICVACNRPVTWRKKWAKNWEQVKYCSDACRRDKSKQVDLTTGCLARSAPAKKNESNCPTFRSGKTTHTLTS